MVLEQQGCGRMDHRPGTLYVSVHYQAKLHLESLPVQQGAFGGASLNQSEVLRYEIDPVSPDPAGEAFGYLVQLIHSVDA
jgi:hypothetical protein